MGCVTATAKRRRKQARSGWKNLRPMDRPRYASHSVETFEKRAAAAAERRSMISKRSRKRSA